MLDIVHLSLRTGTVPTSFKTAVVNPILHRHQFDQVTVTLNNCVISQSLTAKNLGVTFDPTLSSDQHIKEITKVAFFHLGQHH